MFLLLCALCVFVVHGCVYDGLYSEVLGLDMNPDEHRDVRPPFSLVMLNERPGQFNTVNSCVDFCEKHHWCKAATSNGAERAERAEHFCQYHTDRHAIGIDNLNCSLGELDCVLDDNTYLNLDGFTFQVVDSSYYGAKRGEVLVPSRIAGRFCKISGVGVGGGVVTDPVPLFSEYYGEEASPPLLWKPPTYKSEHMGLDNLNIAVNPPVAGYPMLGMSRQQVNPYLRLSRPTYVGRPFEFYNVYRNKYLPQPECSLFNTTTDFIDKRALVDVQAFYIKYSDDKYLSCDDNACSWKATPDMAFLVGDFQIKPSLSHDSGADKSVIAISNDGEHRELGWLDRVHCDSDTEGGRAGVRLIDGASGHCGVARWFFGRSPNKDFLPNGGGTTVGLNTNGEQTYLTAMTGSDDDKAEMCSQNILNLLHIKPMCIGHSHKGASDMRLEVAELPNNVAKLYEIYSDTLRSLRLSCDSFGARLCHWEPDTNQIFKFDNNYVGVGDSGDVKFAMQSLSIYEKIGGMWSHVGYVAAVEGRLAATSVRSASVARGWVKSDRGPIQRGTGIKIDVDTPPNADDEVKVATGAITGVVLVEKTGLVAGDDDSYKWVTDGVDCPAGYYLHQVRCKYDQLCSKRDLGCVQAVHSACKVNSTVVVSVPFEQGKFVDCPDNHVVIGTDGDSINCSPLSRTAVEQNTTFPAHVLPGVFARSTYKITSLTQTNIIDEKLYFGTPIQGFETNEDHFDIFHYGNQCDGTDIEASIGNTLRKPDLTGNARMQCSGDNRFIAYISMADSKNGFAGVNAWCISTKGCKLGDTTTVEPFNGHRAVCPTGSVMVGLECFDHGTDSPCRKVKMICRHVEHDSGFTPSPPTDDGDDDGGGDDGVKIVIIALAAGVPLLVIAAIICLFCIPDAPPELGESRPLSTSTTLYANEYGVLRRRNIYTKIY